MSDHGEKGAGLTGQLLQGRTFLLDSIPVQTLLQIDILVLSTGMSGSELEGYASDGRALLIGVGSVCIKVLS